MSSSLATSTHRDWSSLPSDLLVSIAKRLYSLIDHVRFAAVCSAWNSAVKSNNISPRMPYLLLSGGKRSNSIVLLNLLDNTSHCISPLPETRDKWLKWFIGSQFGYLIMLDQFSNVSLLNPLTRSQVHLPPIATLPYVEPVYGKHGSLKKYIYHRDRIRPNVTHPRKLNLKRFRAASFKKVVLSSDPGLSSNYTVVAIFNVDLILFLRAHENKWNLLGEERIFTDVIYHEGRFIALSIKGRIASIDLSCDPPKTTVLSKQSEDGHTRYLNRYLVVDSSGDLLQVGREVNYSKEKCMFTTCRITIMRLNPKEGTWSPMRSLGEQSLFLGNSYSMSIATHDIPGLRHDCIYFTDDFWDIWSGSVKKMVRDAGVFNIKDGSMELFKPPNNLKLKWPSPVFITPTVGHSK